jgi:hypothetical protein
MKIMKYANLSPTARAKALACDVKDALMTAAWKAEGTEREAELDAMYQLAMEALSAATEAHEAALVASRFVR